MPIVAPLPQRPDDPRLLLAYGTLKEDEPIHGGAAVPSVRTVRRGLWVPGRLYDVGAYPAATLDHEALRGERPVTARFLCDLVEITVPPGRGAGSDPEEALEEVLEATLAAYDAYEDDAYRRIAVPLDDPVHHSAWIYEWVDDTAPLALIRSGVWTSRR